ncbi:hypothetical protein RND71_023642 [Anisodus tanguticus]|uniref:Uncharacterized protein n=1 Tax=Anisodus tanguticus TaxID=243964 RepID=A0AAE1RV82_9SOLA|nr:hypothetical protein RND71_023642 [Anisodus tanguticus]
MDSAKPSAQMEEKDLFKAAESGDSSLFKSLTEEQLLKSLSLRNEDARSLLHVAVSYGHTQIKTIDVIRSEVYLGRLVNSNAEDGWACRHSKAAIGGLLIVDAYLVAGGWRRRSVGGQWSVVVMVVWVGWGGWWGQGMLPLVVKILAAADPSASGINSGDEEGWVPLHSAASSGNVEIVEILLSRGEWIPCSDKISCSATLSMQKTRLVGCTPLHRAASTGNSELCELLIEEGAEVDEVDKAGETPLMTAVVCGNKEVALLLIRHGADVDAEDKEGYTVLGRASNDLRPVLVDAAKMMLEG